MDRFIKFLRNEKQIEELLMSDFSAENLKDYHRYLRTTSKTQKNVSTKTSIQKPLTRSDQTIKTYMRHLRAIGNWFFTRGIIKDNILEDVALPQAAKKNKKILTKAEVASVYNCFDLDTELGLRDMLIFMLALDIGMREGGIASLKVGGINLEQKILSFRLKGGDEHLLPFGKTIARYLREYIIRYRNEADKSEPLFLSRNGGGITENLIKKLFARLKKETGIESLHCHACRHTFATEFVREGKNSIHDLQTSLGHRSQTMSAHYIQESGKITFAANAADSMIDAMLLDRKLPRTKKNTRKKRPAAS
jgi:integrase/recombinase XerC/integrase/recombinase XerD